METGKIKLPQVGDPAPAFEMTTPRGIISFPEYARGSWCVFFAHPANFTSAWTIFSAFLARKERALNESNTKVLAISNLNIGQNDWSDKARRFIGIYLKAPVIEDLDFSIAKMYGIASTRRPQPGCNRLALILDPDGIIRMIVNRPLPDIENDLLHIEQHLRRLQGLEPTEEPVLEPMDVLEFSDADSAIYKPRPAYFSRKNLPQN